MLALAAKPTVARPAAARRSSVRAAAMPYVAPTPAPVFEMAYNNTKAKRDLPRVFAAKDGPVVEKPTISGDLSAALEAQKASAPKLWTSDTKNPAPPSPQYRAVVAANPLNKK